MSLSEITQDTDAEKTAYQPNRAFNTRVCKVQHLSPHFIRITFTDEQLRYFDTGGLDQRIKLLLPREDGTLPDLGLWREPQPAVMEWYTAWRDLPDEQRNPIRTYTVRNIRPQAAEIDVDFAIHGSEGPASAWATEARIGDEMIVVGPDSRYDGDPAGIAFTPGTANRLLLVADETAVPAVCAIMESLPQHYTGNVFLEVPESADFIDISHATGLQVTWLARGGAAHGSALESAVRQWGLQQPEALNVDPAQTQFADSAADDISRESVAPDADSENFLWEEAEPSSGEDYAWLAGESSVITSLRRYLVKELGMSKDQISFMGYWKLGRPGS